MVAGILLAAGSATRMGRNKLLLRLEGETLLRRAARRAIGAGLDPLLVVLGHEADRAREALRGLACRVVENPDHARGINTSLSAGVAALPEACHAAVVLLADMPFVDERMIAGVVARFRETGAPLVVSRFGETHAPPTLYARALLPELVGGEGAGRGGEVVRRHLARAAVVSQPPEGIADVDVGEDLEALQARLEVRR
ncbi:MAG TPA: nucleotidyltransferase family protein [Anaeromyxobacteraceae bacterium]|nr:nucleotidyltransferase family protein [Anaeromyxobacteraceae bacterium]